MREYQREKKIAWYMLVLEGAIIFYTLHCHHGMPMEQIVPRMLLYLLFVIVSRVITNRSNIKRGPDWDFIQGICVMTTGVIGYFIYSISVHSSRMLPACLFFIVVESSIYKNISLNMYIFALGIFSSVFSIGLSELGYVGIDYSIDEFLFFMLLYVVACLLSLMMLNEDLFIERVAREDEKSLDDLLKLVELKCNEATMAAEAKSSFLANMSHEIRTPINAVLGMNEMILRESEEENILGYAHNIQSASTTLLSLINDILDISKIESGKMEVVPEKYELGALLYDLILVIQPRLEKKNLLLILDIDKDIPNQLYGDEVRIRQIITNILTNAVKYTETGSVTFHVHMTRRDKAHIVLHVAVEDTGIGIKEGKDVLVQSFQRGGDLKAHHIEGTGLGLSITQQLLHLMDSELEMESVYGEGSTFSFHLVQTVLDDTPMGDINELYQKRIKSEKKYQVSFEAPMAEILVVDDNSMNRSVVKALLKQTKVGIDMAENGKQAVEMCDTKAYDLVLMDHLMPVMDGVEAFRAIRSNELGPNYHTPIVILTANAVAGMKQTFLDEGFDGFLSKPIQGELLEVTLMKYLPKELVTIVERDEDSGAEESERLQILKDTIERLDFIELSLEDAMQFSSGQVVDALDNMKGYLTESEDVRKNLTDEYERGDWNNFKIHVHALKSTSRIIGAVHLGYLAEQMELASGREDEAFLHEHMSELMDEYKEFCGCLRELLDQPEVQAIMKKKIEVTTDLKDYLQKLEKLLEQVENFDVDFDEMGQFVGSFPAQNHLEEERRKLEEAVDAFDYEGISDQLKAIREILK
ncbi:MAG: response regulator [Lachnospiraceae bacterium]|nr:response regulator [Lachnospiraceae bacterium]MDY3817552.1 response regulator [Lachnospiraceae bacterium]